MIKVLSSPGPLYSLGEGLKSEDKIRDKVPNKKNFLFIYANCGPFWSFYRNIEGLIKFSLISLKTQIALLDIHQFAQKNHNRINAVDLCYFKL